MIRIALLSTALLMLAVPALASASDRCLPQVHDGWIRKPPADLPVMAGYARIENPCGAPATIVAANSDAFADTSLHETRVEGGISRMRAASALQLPVRGSVAMAPGGLHLMLMNPVAPLQAGAKVPVVFTLQDGRKVRGELEVRATR